MEVNQASEYRFNQTKDDPPNAIRREGEFMILVFVVFPKGEWANPGGTAIPGRPVAKVEQAPDTSPRFKNQFNIEAPT